MQDKKRNKLERVIIFLIIVLASILRLYKLGSYPALNADEAAIGYNAYSLILTGKDEHGNSWPIHFQSFNDYKPGLYFYLVIPFVKLLGLNEWSVRLPNAFFGVISVYLIYLIVKRLEFNHVVNFSFVNLEIISAFLLATSPWHIHFSRGGWEVNCATFFILVGIYLFILGLQKRKGVLFTFSLLFFVLSLYTYHSARIVAPLVLLALILSFFHKTKNNLKAIFYSSIICIVFLTPLFLDLFTPEVLSRVAGVGLLADSGPIERTNEQRMEHPGKISVFLHNKVTNYSLVFLKNWGEHYHGLFLFVSGDTIQRNAVPETGQLYLFEIFTVAIGLVYIFVNFKKFPNQFTFIILWLLIAPVPAALTFQSPHALRSQNMVIPITIVSSIGMVSFLNYLSNTKKTFVVVTGLFFVVIICWSFARYLHMYWGHMSKEYPFSSQYGVKELVRYISQQNDKFDKIVVTNRYDQPYILFLFYLKYPPSKFQKEHVLSARDKYGFSTVENFSNFVFKKISWDEDRINYPRSLIIGTDKEIPKEANITRRIYGSNGFLYFLVVEN